MKAAYIITSIEIRVKTANFRFRLDLSYNNNNNNNANSKWFYSTKNNNRRRRKKLLYCCWQGKTYLNKKNSIGNSIRTCYTNLSLIIRVLQKKNNSTVEIFIRPTTNVKIYIYIYQVNLIIIIIIVFVVLVKIKIEK